MCSHTPDQPAEPDPEPYDDPLKRWKAAQPVRKKRKEMELIEDVIR